MQVFSSTARLTNRAIHLCTGRLCVKQSYALLTSLPNNPKHSQLSHPISQPKFTPLFSFTSTQPNPPVTRKEKFKKAIAEYGTTVIVFHVTISLISLGGCYMAVTSGVDVPHYMTLLGFSEKASLKFASSAGTFVAAYAVHKVFAPIRISITLGATPLIVRFLRNKGYLKKPQK